MSLKCCVIVINQQADKEVKAVTEGRFAGRGAAVAADGLRQVGAGMLEEGGTVGFACSIIRQALCVTVIIPVHLIASKGAP